MTTRNMDSVGQREFARWAVRSVIFPVQEILKGHSTFEKLKEMVVDESRSPEELLDLQRERLRLLLEEAITNVPYYRELLGDSPIDTKRAELGSIPFLTKDLIRNNLDRLKNINTKKFMRFNTGGSTGEPLIFFLGKKRVSSDVAARWRAEGWWGLGVGDREFVIWGAPVELKKQDRVRLLRDRVMRTRLLSAFEMSPKVMDGYIDDMVGTKARRVFGYPSSIALLCERAQERGVDLREIGAKAVFVTGEYLWDHWRTTIQESFGCPVANGYGGRDSGFIAHECPAGGMHITADRMIVEIVDQQGKCLPPEELGEIVVTHFDTAEFPFIRYRTGDVGAISSRNCSCGRSLPLLSRIEGRQTDFVIAPDGRVMHGLSLIYVLRDQEGIQKFRIHQKAPDRFEIKIVKGNTYDPKSEVRIKEGLSARLKSKVWIEICYVDDIPALASGKYRYVISDVTGAAMSTGARNN